MEEATQMFSTSKRRNIAKHCEAEEQWVLQEPEVGGLASLCHPH